jgi:7,8-dihydro-6-hydroxymethylpterin-pyrophosphokinase
MIYKYFLGLGSNIEPRKAYLIKACGQLALNGIILKKSSLYQTQAWGGTKSAGFY